MDSQLIAQYGSVSLSNKVSQGADMPAVWRTAPPAQRKKRPVLVVHSLP